MHDVLHIFDIPAMRGSGPLPCQTPLPYTPIINSPGRRWNLAILSRRRETHNIDRVG
jgi:hypothetical protein